MEYESKSGTSSREIVPYAACMPNADARVGSQVGIQYAGPDITSLKSFVDWMRDLDLQCQCHS